MKRRWLSILLLLGAAVALAQTARADRATVRDSLRDVEPWLRPRWLAARGLEDYYRANSWKPAADSGLACIGRWSYGPSARVSLRVTDTDTIICLTRGSGASLIRFRSHDSLTLNLLSDIDCSGIVSRAIIRDTLVFCGMQQGGTGIEIWSISDLTAPHRLSYVYLPPVMDIAVKDTFLYAIGYQQDSLRVFNVADPSNPLQVGACADSGIHGMAVSGDYCYLADQYGLYIVDVSNPHNPHRVGSIGGFEALAVTVRDTLCFVGTYTSEFALRVYNVRNPATPIPVGSLSGVEAHDIYFPPTCDTVLYTPKLHVINIADPASPRQIGFMDCPGWDYGVVATPALGHALVADYFKGMVVVNVSNPTAPSIETMVFAGDQAVDITIDNDRAYVASYLAGLQILDVSDPTKPTYLGSYDTTGSPGTVRSATARDSFAFVSWPRPRMLTVDVANPRQPARVAGCDGVLNYPQDMVIRDSFVYIAEVNRFQIVNVARPREPVLVGSCAAGDLTRAGLVVRDTLAYFIGPFDGLEVYNVADPSTPVRVTTVARIRAAGCDVVDTLLYVGDYDDSLHIWSFANPLAPYQLSSAYAVRSGYGVAVLGRYAYVGCDSRVRVFDVLDPRNPVEVGSCATPYEIRRVEAGNGHVYVCCWEAGVSIFDTFQTGIEDRPSPSFQSPALVVSSPVAGDAVLLEFRAKPGSAAYVAVTDAVGRVLLRDRPVVVPGSGIYRYRMDVGGLPAGVYIINARVGLETRLTRFVKLKRR
jgi:hypothetical protein